MELNESWMRRFPQQMCRLFLWRFSHKMLFTLEQTERDFEKCLGQDIVSFSRFCKNIFLLRLHSFSECAGGYMRVPGPFMCLQSCVTYCYFANKLSMKLLLICLPQTFSIHDLFCVPRRRFRSADEDN